MSKRLTFISQFKVTVNNPDPLMTLYDYIRTVANLKVCCMRCLMSMLLILLDDAQGTKKSCLEGGCGACVVSLTQFNPIQQKNTTFSVNSVCDEAALSLSQMLMMVFSVSATAVQC